MRFFNSQLFNKLNSENDDIVDNAEIALDKASDNYLKHIKSNHYNKEAIKLAHCSMHDMDVKRLYINGDLPVDIVNSLDLSPYIKQTLLKDRRYSSFLELESYRRRVVVFYKLCGFETKQSSIDDNIVSRQEQCLYSEVVLDMDIMPAAHFLMHQVYPINIYSHNLLCSNNKEYGIKFLNCLVYDCMIDVNT